MNQSDTPEYNELFDSEWYAANYPEAAEHPLEHYLKFGVNLGYRPNPYFQPLWYIAQNKDVAQNGIEPLLHYARYGWLEGRDASPVFSTSYYLEINPDVAESGKNPLAHFIKYGVSEGRGAHPSLASINLSRPKVGIVILSYNNPEVLDATLNSIYRSKTRTAFKVYLIENGSSKKTKIEVRQIVNAVTSTGADVFFIDSDRNHGFSGGNNICIARALEDGCTHICMLNSDVVVTDGWLDGLLDTLEVAVGPVSNQVGNEQTVPADIICGPTVDAWDLINDLAVRRRSAYRPDVRYTNFIGFFCALVRADVFPQVGMLDERFYPGSFEDDDYCLRLYEAGVRMAVRRDIYVHHHGSASFSTLEFATRLNISDENKRRFETKHNRPWQDRSHLLVRSWLDDEEGIARNGSPAAIDLHKFSREHHFNTVQDLVKRLTGAVEHLKRKEEFIIEALKPTIDILSEGAVNAISIKDVATRIAQIVKHDLEFDINSLRFVNFGDRPYAVDVLSSSARGPYADYLFSTWRFLQHNSAASANVLVACQKLIASLSAIVNSNDCVAIFADIDPTDCNMKDGFVQRVLAIDESLEKSTRLYVVYSERFRNRPVLERINTRLWVARVADDDKLAEPLLEPFISKAAIYVHSVLRFNMKTTRKFVDKYPDNTIIDVHGAVPEEFKMYNDPFSAQIHEGYEKKFFPAVKNIICVSHKMTKHLNYKYPGVLDKAIFCPIFASDVPQKLDHVDSQKRYKIVYAGGTQKWQKVPLMTSIIRKLKGEVDFAIFTPDVKTFREALMDGDATESLDGIVIESLSPAEVRSRLPNYDFGLLLRDDSVVNQVACPTKLIEYMATGVIPIIDAEIGDFIDFGLECVRYTELLSGNLPDIERRRFMANRNLEILLEVARKSASGLDDVRAAVNQITERLQ